VTELGCSCFLIFYVSNAFNVVCQYWIGTSCCLQQATGGGDGGDGGYYDFQEGTSSGYGGFSGYGDNLGAGYGGHNHDDDDDDEEEGSEDEEDDDEDEDEEDEYGGGQSLGMAALNIKEFKIEGGGSTSKGKSTK